MIHPFVPHTQAYIGHNLAQELGEPRTRRSFSPTARARRPAALLAILGSLLPIPACSSESSGAGATEKRDDGGGATKPQDEDGGVTKPRVEDGGATPSPASAGKVGASCTADADCDAGLACIGSGIVDADGKYCAPECQSAADCDALAATSYSLHVPPTVTPQGGTPTPNLWGTTTLARGMACVPVDGAAGKRCQFGCGPFQALGADGNCYCLPGYRLDEARKNCVFAPADIQCTLFSMQSEATKQELARFGIQVSSPACDACNSSMDFTNTIGCHTGVFGCELSNVGFKGRCAEFLSSTQLSECLIQKTNYVCDCRQSCVDPCVDGSASIGTCMNGCCTCTGGSTAPAPTCTTGAGGSTSTGAGGSTSSSGGSGVGGSGAGAGSGGKGTGASSGSGGSGGSGGKGTGASSGSDGATP